MLTVLPWQLSQWQQLMIAHAQQRLHHALLLTGPEGIGLYEFAHTLSASLLCFSPTADSLPCGTCKSCTLLLAGNHSDLYTAMPDEPGKQLKVDAIRELIEFIVLKSQFERYKVAIIYPADQMNRSAANSLLKTLEEPPAQSLLILLSQRPDQLPVTIRSRCQQLQFNPVYDQSAVTWLAGKLPDSSYNPHELLLMAGGAPFAALACIENNLPEKLDVLAEELELLYKRQSDPVSLADKWSKQGASQILLWLLQMFNEMLRLKIVASASERYPAIVTKRLQRLTNRLDLYRLVQCHDLLLKNYGLSSSQTSFDAKGLLEDFTIHWQAVSA